MSYLTIEQAVVAPRTAPAQPAWSEPTPTPARGADGTACLQAVLDALDTGVLVCDAGGRVLLLNRAAREDLPSRQVLQLGPGQALLVRGTGAGQSQLNRALQQAVFGGRRQLLPLRDGPHALMVAVQPLQLADGSPPRALVLLGRRQLAPELLVEMLGGVYALTHAERRVLSGLLAGQRVQALAEVHGVAISTVRTQVAALRAKFGVRRLDDITRLAAELPPMVGALRSSAALAACGLPA